MKSTVCTDHFFMILDNHYHILFSISSPDEFHSVQFVTPDRTPDKTTKIDRNDEMNLSEFRYALQKKKIIEFIRKQIRQEW